MNKINNKEAISLAVISSLEITVLVSSQIIATSCVSSSLINAGYISLIALIITFVICKLYKTFIGISFLDIAEFLGGKLLKFIVGIIFLSYFLFTAGIILCKAVNCLEMVYYPMTNISYTVLLFIIPTIIACNLKNNGFLKATFLIIPFVLIAIFLIFAGNLKNFNYENIFPIFGTGIDSTFISGISNLFSFGGIAYIFFLPEHLEKPDKFMKVSLWSTIISSFLLIVTVATTILMFNKNITSGELFPLYMAVRNIEFGTFFQRLDAAFLLVMNIAICSFLGIYGNLCLGIIKEIAGITDTRPLSYPFALLLFSFTVLIDAQFTPDIIQDTTFKIFFFIVITLGIIILILSNLKKKKHMEVYHEQN